MPPQRQAVRLSQSQFLNYFPTAKRVELLRTLSRLIEGLAWLTSINQIIVSGYPNSKAYIDRLVEH
jgi:hypothetical protein